MGRLSKEQIQKIKEVYLAVGTYSGTAKICGNSVATVKKYVEQEDKKEEVKTNPRIYFNQEIPKVEDIFIPDYGGRAQWLVLSKEELCEIEELRKES